MMKSSFYSPEELSSIGLKSYGKDVKISRYARFYSPETIEMGDNVRIDDFCILSGTIKLGSHIHISAYVALYGSMGIVLEDYTGISPRTSIFSAMDDFSGNFLIGPIHPDEKTNVTGGKVILKKYVQIGAHCVLFPNVTIEEGVAIGACSMVNNNMDEWGVYWGVPAQRQKERRKGLLQFIK